MFVRLAKFEISVLLALAIGVWPAEEPFAPSAMQHRRLRGHPTVYYALELAGRSL